MNVKKKLDYTRGCVNFRDVGEWINLISGREVLPKGRIYRGGKIDFVETLKEIGNPGTIINLRRGPDPTDKIESVDYFHFPISNNFEVYQTSDKEVRKWLNQIFMNVRQKPVRFPVFFHCLSGKDRTSVVIAALLKILGFENQFIIEEYLLNDGDVNEERICMSLEGIENTETYFNRVDLGDLRNLIKKSN